MGIVTDDEFRKTHRMLNGRLDEIGNLCWRVEMEKFSLLEESGAIPRLTMDNDG
jgi:hypothetical protein